MRYSRFIHFSHLRKTLTQNLPFNPLSTPIPKPQFPSFFPRTFNTATQQSNDTNPLVQSEKVTKIVDELMGLTLTEVMDLVDVMREKKGINELPLMMVMVPGMGVAGLKGALKGAAKGGGGGGGGGVVEEKAEKTAFDLKLDAFDAASKIKVIKEVRTFTSLGLKEAKDLVEKVPAVLKTGVTKEEAESIIAKMKEVGAKVSME